MKKTKFLSLLLASAMVVSMAATPVLAADTEFTDPTASNQITGNSGLEPVTYRVVVPTTLTFAIDPYEQAGKSQIYSGDLSIINKSNVPVKVVASVSVEENLTTVTDEEVTFVTSADAVKEDETKNLYFAAEVATAITEEKYTADDATAFPGSIKIFANAAGDAWAKLDAADSTYTTEVFLEDVKELKTIEYTTAPKVTVDGENATDLTFVLAEAKYIPYDDAGTMKSIYQSTAADNKGSAAFRFSGAVNSNVDWDDEELTATVAYDFQGMTDTNYGTEAAKATQGYLKAEEEPTFTASATLLTIDYTKGLGTKALKSIDKIEMMHDTAGAQNVYVANSTHWGNANDTGSVITLDSGVANIWSGETTEATIYYTLEDTSTGTAKVNVVTKVVEGN